MMIRKILLYVVISIIFTFSSFEGANAQRVFDNKSINLTVQKGQIIQIQKMYAVNRIKCTGDKNPPRPIFFGKVKFGTIKYRLGTTAPYQCPKITINANYADYIASDIIGVDKFRIHWKSENGTIFIRNYKIEVK